MMKRKKACIIHKNSNTVKTLVHCQCASVRVHDTQQPESWLSAMRAWTCLWLCQFVHISACSACSNADGDEIVTPSQETLRGPVEPSATTATYTT